MSPQYRGFIRLFLLAIFDVLVILGIQGQIKGKNCGTYIIFRSLDGNIRIHVHGYWDVAEQSTGILGVKRLFTSKKTDSDMSIRD